jgi:hypothetical protein
LGTVPGTARAAQDTSNPSGRVAPETTNEQTQPEGELKKISISGSWKLEPAAPNSNVLIPGQATIELPDLDVNSQYEINLSLHNPNSYPISFSEASVGCACSSAKFSNKTFLPNQTALVQVYLKTPKSNLDNEIKFSITLYSDFECQDFAGSIYVAGKLQGNLFLDKKQRIFQLSEKNSVVKIPFSFSHPVSFERLRVEPSEVFRDFPIDLAREGKRYFLTMAVPSDRLAQGYLSGHLKLVDHKLKLEDAAEIVCEERNPVVISPSYVRFRKQPNQTGQVANFLIRIDGDTKDVESRFETGVKIRCYLDRKILDLRIRKLSDSVFRGTIVVPQKQVLPNGGQLQWEVDADGKSFRLSTEFENEE